MLTVAIKNCKGEERCFLLPGNPSFERVIEKIHKHYPGWRFEESWISHEWEILELLKDLENF